MNSFPCLINTQGSVFIHICLLANNHQGVKHFLLSQGGTAAAQELPDQKEFWQEKKQASMLSANPSLITLAGRVPRHVCPWASQS